MDTTSYSRPVGETRLLEDEKCVNWRRCTHPAFSYGNARALTVEVALDVHDQYKVTQLRQEPE